MKIKFLFCSLLIACLTSCGGDKKQTAANHPFEGTFTTEYGMKFQLKSDSTTLLLFDDSISYEGEWKVRQKNGAEYANIEFAGYINYYFLKDGKLYRKEQQMLDNVNGIDISYLE